MPHKPTEEEIRHRIRHIGNLAVPERAWLAGLCEGEGSFYRIKSTRHAYPRVAVEMTDRDVIQRVSHMCGYDTVYEMPQRGNRRRSYRIMVTGRVAVALMRSIQPYLFSRRADRVQELLEEFGQEEHG
jgi:hypothetical protein